MSIGNSGRIVIEVDPTLKKVLYSALTKDGLSLKEWFLRSAAIYLENQSQQPLSLHEQVNCDDQSVAQYQNKLK